MATDEYRFIEFNSTRAFQDVQTLVDFGSRLTGSPNEYVAAEYIKSEMEKATLSNVNHYLFPNPLYRFKNGNITDLSLQVSTRTTTANQTVVVEQWPALIHITDYMAVAYSGSQAFVGKELIYVGNTSLLHALDVRGKVTLVDPRNSTLSGSDMYKSVLEAGAAGSILIGTDELPISRSCTGRDKDGHFLAFPVAYPDLTLIPHLVTSRQLGLALYDALHTSDSSASSSTVQISLNFSNFEVFDGNISVVCGERVGSKPPSERKLVMFGGHHDSVFDGPGAVDNAEGTGQIIEMARQISTWNVNHTVRVCTWGGEEEGLLGSYYYSEQFMDELQRDLIFYFNGDMSANEAGYYTMRFEMMTGDPNVPILQEIIRQYYERGTPGLDLSKYKLSVTQRSTPGGSDHQTFILDGFETVAAVGSSAPGNYHRPSDTIEHVDGPTLQLAYMVMGTFGYSLATFAPPPPGGWSSHDHSSIPSWAKTLAWCALGLGLAIFVVVGGLLLFRLRAKQHRDKYDLALREEITPLVDP
eukprot:CAMPEP_0177646794 /NCGR_PEP_ID=MMETSP0447-20121125/9956_1 /TAXON_ID=0 /ORGANISM="Stygamoeba regulata, Strain BSH-02190019" /LENGTH=526 /DNA_ID=CAMNT_0019149335 /DNA_START=173 /DNA_END=1753 /DNA_ORIENTATION=+